MYPIGSICHSDHDPADGVRVTLFAGDNGNVWAAGEGEEPYDTDTPIDRVADAWSGPQWDFQPCDM